MTILMNATIGVTMAGILRDIMTMRTETATVRAADTWNKIATSVDDSVGIMTSTTGMDIVTGRPAADVETVGIKTSLVVMATKTAKRVRVRKQVPQDGNADPYNEFKEFEGAKYTGSFTSPACRNRIGKDLKQNRNS